MLVSNDPVYKDKVMVSNDDDKKKKKKNRKRIWEVLLFTWLGRSISTRIPVVPLGHGKSRDFRGMSSSPAAGTNNDGLFPFVFVFAIAVVVVGVDVDGIVALVVLSELQSLISWIAGGFGKMTDRFLSSSLDFMFGNSKSMFE